MRAALIAAAAILGTQTLAAQTIDPAFQLARVARAAAIAAGDDEALLRYTTDDFIHVGAEGEMLTRTERLAENKRIATAQGSQGGVKRPPLSGEQEVRVYGETVITSARGVINIQGVMRDMRVMQVWVKQNGEWKVAHAQNTLIANEK